LKRAVDACTDVIFMTDAHGLIIFVNPPFTAVYGYRPDEIVGQVTPRILKSGMHSREHYAQFWDDLVHGRSVPVRMVNRAKDGRLVEIEGSANPIVEDGVIDGFVAVQRDVTTEHSLQNQHLLAQFASDQAADGIFWVTQDSRIQYANEAATQMLGYARDQLCTMSALDIAPSFSPESFAEHFRAHFSSGRTRIETTMRRRDGTEFPAEIALSYRELDGERSSCAVVRDLTERQQLEAELQQAQKMEVIGRLAGGIAHDFNNVLTAILGYSELALQQVPDNPGLSADIEEIKTAGERAGRLTRQLLGFSRKQAIAPRAIDLDQLVEDLRPMATRVMGDDVQLDVVAGTPRPSVFADTGQVEQVLMNLLVNARDAMPKGGRVTITTATIDLDADFARTHAGVTPGPHVALTVSDTGSGMAPDVLARAREPFFTTKPEGKGTGLGLATVCGIVQDSGGCVVIESQIGAGTTVTSYFPRVEASREVETLRAEPSWSATGTEAILLVEDDPSVRELTQRLLSASGHTVLPARDGEEALRIEAGHAGDIHLLLTDVLMPKLSGPDLAQRLVRRRPAMKVLYISGFGHQMAVASRLVRRQTAFLKKPFTPEMLALTVRQLLDRPVGAQAQAFATR
jgi:PAS domain S-box-containing protein